jgi:A/G-specific adenine glycosylase
MGEGVTDEGSDGRKGNDGRGATAEEAEGALPADIEEVREALRSWYERDHREFPWRRTDDPYEVLVSEVMSQQTQLDRVVGAWRDFLDRWPTVAELTAADRSAVVGFWSEHRLGYNNRAKYLHEAAGQVLDEFDGEFPRDPDGLEELQGVGPYTANAVASFAFDNGDAVVDTNVKRVLYRAFSVPDESEAFEGSARALMPAGESKQWNNAIMELGGVACGKTPRCDEENCPWRAWCEAYTSGDFSAPDVPARTRFEGSRRQFRGRIVDVLRSHDALALDDLGPRVRVDYAPEGTHGREWLYGLAEDLASDGLIEIENRESRAETVLRLRH